MPDGVVLFSFKHLVYRPAAGITAFPDGGVPKYLKDEAVLATYHVPSGALNILRREPNRRWTDGQGQFTISRSKGRVALVSRGGQLRSDLSTIATEDWLLDVSSGDFQPVDWRTALPARGLAMTGLYLVDERGTLLFVTVPAPPAGKVRDETVAWLWIRTPGGHYIQVAQTSHYEGMAGDELIHWTPGTRRFKAFNVVTHETRDLPGYRVPPHEEVTKGVSVEADGHRLLLGRKGEGGWESEPIPLDPERLK